jgi:dephospho-CoA kinase
MTITFRPAIRENVGLIIGLAGGTGSGKTYTAMRLAAGIAGDKPFAVIDTEAGRAKHYADAFRFDHAELLPPFRPAAYAEAIMAADEAGYSVIVVDSVSHVWAGDGGVLDWQEEELTRMAGDDWKKREAVKMAAWIKPKMAHKHMVQKLLQVRAHLILCFRAEEKIEMIREDGKMKIVPKITRTGLDGWVPVCEKNLPFELTASFLLTSDKPGIPKPIKLQEQHRALFPLDKPITEESGRLIAQWASGGKAKESAATQERPIDTTGTNGSHVKQSPTSGETARTPAPSADLITPDQIAAIETRCQDHGISIDRVKAAAKVGALSEIQASRYAGAMAWLDKQIDAMETTT